MITSLNKIGSNLIAAWQEERDLLDGNAIAVRNGMGELIGLRWPYRLNDQGMYYQSKRGKGVWNGNYWTFPTTDAADLMLVFLQKNFPNLPVFEATATANSKTEKGTEYAVMQVFDGLFACVLSRKLSYFTAIPGVLNKRKLFEMGWPWPESQPCPAGDVFHVGADATGLIAILASPDTIGKIVDGIAKAGATEQPSLTRQFQTLSKVKVLTSKWAVEIWIDLSNPQHWSLGRETYEKKGGWAKASTTRGKWPRWKEKIGKAGLEWEGDPEAQDLSVPVCFDIKRVEGWDTPAPNGHLLHAYQKEGVKFCASRGMRALIGDEMGVGKTVQAIAAAEATSAQRIVIICPANARYVWEREIRGWGGRGSIQHIESQLEKLDMSVRWHILTYDLIAVRAETWRLNDEEEVKAFVEAFPQFSNSNEINKGSYPRKVSLEKPLTGIPAFADSKRIVAWEKLMQRLRGELLEQILAAGPMLTILDEAHRVKNKAAKRTKAIQQLAASETQLLMLTGTPLRNNEYEAAVLLSLLDNDASSMLSTTKGYSIEDIKDYLGYFMIRRTKAEVLPELPEKTRQRIDLDKLDQESMEQYHEALFYAHDMYARTLNLGKSEAEARQAMQGGIEKARAALGTAKVLGGEVIDLVCDVIENKKCCVVFCAHHDASDKLKAQLEQKKLRVAIIDGRVPPIKRAEIVADFQGGLLDVVIGGINAAGEAITLTRADTVIFVELDWVPAALMQAEDRIHRVGQKSNCQIIQLVARMDGDNLDDLMVHLLGVKMARIGAVLNEDTSNIITSSIKTEFFDLLLGKAGMPHSTSVAIVQQQEKSEPVEAVAQVAVAADKTAMEAIQPPVGSGDKSLKPKRGRPKVYLDNAPPTATERSKQSIKALAEAGGKRVMLRLTPEAHEALKVIMAIMGGTEETATINQVLIARKNDLLCASTQK